jgi:Ca-activated chloride channel family protein
VTAGGDDCGGDLGAVLQELAEGDHGLEVRIVGLGLDRDTANAATMLLPTRNVFDAGGLAEALSWALGLDRPRPRPVDFEVEFGGRPIESGTLVIKAALGDATTTATIDRGAARARLDPGLYDLTVPTTDGAQMTVSGFAVSHDGGALRIEIPDIAPVTLEIDPELPWNSSTIYVHYWGAPAEGSTVVVAEADAELREWLVRAEAEGPTGEVALRLPGSSRDLEARMLCEIGEGAVVEVGRATITSRQPTAAIDVPESVEISTPMTVTWEGPNLPGDHLMVTGAGGASVVACITARSGGPVELVAPAVPGTYTVRYMNAMERALARSDIEVYEILATIDFLPHVRSRNEVEVAWTGPAGELDFLSLARPDAEPEVYSEWAPVAEGSPLRLQAPAAAGDYEIRYVRGSDHEILARADLHVVTVDLELKVPPRVRAGERFKIRLRGTTEPGDIIAVAAVEADVRDHLDWVDADGEGSYDLAAPFEPGTYEVRYITSSDLEIRARSTFEAR